jgi:hypothetical protein
LGVSVTEFWNKHLGDEAVCGGAYFHNLKGDLNF